MLRNLGCCLSNGKRVRGTSFDRGDLFLMLLAKFVDFLSIVIGVQVAVLGFPCLFRTIDDRAKLDAIENVATC